MTVSRVASGIVLAMLGIVATSASAQIRPDPVVDPLPYAETASVTMSPPFVNNFIFFPTPKGHRYIIEQASVSCTTPSNTDVFTQALLQTKKIINANTTTGQSSPVVVLEKRGPAPFGGYIWTGSAHVTVISDADPFTADGGTAISFNIFHTEPAAAGLCSATLYGHTQAP